jgi:hypothetical protein
MGSWGRARSALRVPADSTRHTYWNDGHLWHVGHRCVVAERCRVRRMPGCAARSRRAYHPLGCARPGPLRLGCGGHEAEAACASATLVSTLTKRGAEWSATSDGLVDRNGTEVAEPSL